MIRAPQVRVVGADGHQLGIMSLQEAVRAAQQQGLDLVEVAPSAQPPVCRITNFDKFRYAQKKKTHDAHRKTSAGGVKEVKVRARTERHDIEFKVRHIRRFLGEGQRVKLSVFFRGREITHPELGQVVLQQIVQLVNDVAQTDGGARMEGRSMSVMLTPRA
ncbi:MAG: translation initiation factor IF-3 [Deltaproteobacteria bacterium]|jgi:translation initiation factor IF-3|nr:translation initiation factor IF-3 [Deltaproteobacteria bacterium]